TATAIWFHKRGCAIRRCADCMLVFTDGAWPAEQARSFYGAEYFTSPEGIGYANYAGLETALRATARARLRGLRPGHRLLDIGCGSGVFVDEARRRFHSVGSDVSAAACRTARQHGLDVVVNETAAL